MICQSCHNCREDCACPSIGFRVGATYADCAAGYRRISGVVFSWLFEPIGETWRRPIWLPTNAQFDFFTEEGTLLASFFPPDTAARRETPTEPDAAFDPSDADIACLPKIYAVVRDIDSGDWFFQCWICPNACDQACGSDGSGDSGSGGGSGTGTSGSSDGSSGGSQGDTSGSGSGSGSGGGDLPPTDPPTSSSSSGSASGGAGTCTCTVSISAVAFRLDNESPTTCYVTFDATVEYSAACDFSGSPAAGLWSYSIGVVTGNGPGASEVPVDCLPDGTIAITATFTPTGGGPVAPSAPCSTAVTISSILA